MACNKSSKPFEKGKKLESTKPLAKLSDFRVMKGADKGTPQPFFARLRAS